MHLGGMGRQLAYEAAGLGGEAGLVRGTAAPVARRAPGARFGVEPVSANRLGVISNPFSKRNRDDRRQSRNSRHSDWTSRDILYAEPDTSEALLETLQEFARREVDLLAVDGGDGTVREVLTALPRAHDEFRPALAVLPSGNANMIAADVGVGDRGLRAVERLAEDARAGRLGGRVRRRFPMEVHRPGHHAGPIRGMFFGAAAFTDATALARSTHRFGANHGLDVVVTLAATLAEALSGPGRQRWLAGRQMSLGLDAAAPRKGGRALFLATTLHQLILGMWPFWGDNSKAIRYLDVAEHPNRIGAAILPMLRGQPADWMLDEGYHSGSAGEMRLTLSDPFIVDGERFDPPACGGELIVRPGAPIDFIGR